MTLDQPLVVSEPPRSTSPTWRVSVPLPAIAALIGAVPFVMHAWSALHGYFWQDDFVIVYRAAHANPVDPGYLFQAYNGEHIAPGMFLLAWLVTAIAPLSYPVAVLPLLIMQAAAVVLFWRLLVRCFGARWAILPPFAVFAWSPLILVPSLWWAFGAQIVPGLLAMIGALHAQVRHVQDGDRRFAMSALLWMAFGLAFYEKAALIPALLLAVTVLVEPAPVVAVLRRYRWLWLSLAGLVVGYAAGYLALTSTVSSGDGRGQLPELARRMLAETFLSGILGVPPDAAGPGLTWVPAPLPVRILAWVLALAVIASGLAVGRRRALLAWLLLAGYLAVDLILVGLTRLRIVGTLIGADPRYLADAVPVAVLCAAFALLGPGARPVPRHAGMIIAVLTVAFTVGATVTYWRLAPAAQARHARDYLANASATLTPDLVLYDGNVPDDVMVNWFGPDARQSVVLSLLPGQLRFDQPAERLYRLDADGRPRLIERLTGETGLPGPAPGCGYPVTRAGSSVPLTNPVHGRVIVRLGYYTADPGDGQLEVGDAVVGIHFERGLHVLYVPVDGEFGVVTVRRATELAPVCVTDVLAGEPVG
jgi:hypothetical protein